MSPRARGCPRDAKWTRLTRGIHGFRWKQAISGRNGRGRSEDKHPTIVPSFRAVGQSWMVKRAKGPSASGMKAKRERQPQNPSESTATTDWRTIQTHFQGCFLFCGGVDRHMCFRGGYKTRKKQKGSARTSSRRRKVDKRVCRGSCRLALYGGVVVELQGVRPGVLKMHHFVSVFYHVGKGQGSVFVGKAVWR